MTRKYMPGDAVGPYGVILIERLPREGNERDPKMLFQCPQCGGKFKAQLCSVSTGKKKACNKCTDQRVYEVGGRFGPANTLMLERNGVGKDVWECSYCGNSFVANRYDIGSGHTTSCGCYRSKCSSERKTLDLTGQKFGRLTAIQIDEERSKKSKEDRIWSSSNVWLCECECGEKNVYVKTSDLTNGHTQSCGCLQRERSKNANSLNLIGQKFGKLTAIRMRSDLKEEKKNNVWECICECGNTACFQTYELTSGMKRHCGCETSMSLGESLVMEILDDYEFEYEIQWHHKTCVNPETNALLFFDFKLSDKNMLIEFDGRQHFQNKNNFGNNNYIDIRKRDSIKNQWCSDNDFMLIRIPYTYYNKLVKNPDLLMCWLCGEDMPVLPEYDPV